VRIKNEFKTVAEILGSTIFSENNPLALIRYFLKMALFEVLQFHDVLNEGHRRGRQ